MPYVTEAQRRELDKGAVPEDEGELNYVITKLVLRYVEHRKSSALVLRYMMLNEVIGALECAKLEFYRRLAIPYENAKIKENGDVYR